MNIFSQIGIIMLIGLVAKNGILIVEFANQKQEAGLDKMRRHRGGLAATPAPDPDDARLDHPRPAAADRRHGRRRQRTYRHGYRRGGRHGGLDAADALHRSGHLQLRIDEPNQEIETQRRNENSIFSGPAAGNRQRRRSAGGAPARRRPHADPAQMSGDRA